MKHFSESYPFAILLLNRIISFEREIEGNQEKKQLFKELAKKGFFM